MTGIKCFLLVPADLCSVSMRRYAGSDGVKKCPVPANHGYHNAHTPIGDFVPVKTERGSIREMPMQPKTDPRWPTHCACGYMFVDSDEWQMFQSSLYRRVDTSELMTLENAPVGAMWDAEWFHGYPHWCGPDGRSLHVKTPGGDWCIDARCANCTLPNDKVHKCWVRHGEPPLITVDKDGVTCSAGGGSISQPGYHGFLRNGELVQCR